MYIFKDKYCTEKPLNIIFLCGSRFSRNNPRDKRIVLQNYIHSSIPNSRAIILEQNFDFRTSTKGRLSYDDIFLTGLGKIEQLTALYADRIVIVHESISTSAELGMFSVDPLLSEKICAIVPDKFSSEEDKVSGFLRLSFFKQNSTDNSIYLLRYFPDREVYRFSENKSDYHYYFHNDCIGPILSARLIGFLEKQKNDSGIIAKHRFGKCTQTEGRTNYRIDDRQKSISISLTASALKNQLLSMLFCDDINSELSIAKMLSEHVSYLQRLYAEIMQNTISHYEGVPVKDYSMEFEILHSSCEIRQAIGLFLYFLQAAGLITLIQGGSPVHSYRRVSITSSLKEYSGCYSRLIEEIKPSAFGRLCI